MSADTTDTGNLGDARHESVLVYRSFRYLRIAAALCAAAIVAYIAHDPVPEPNGGTWLGYTLGTISLGIIIFLAWFGIRKRRYAFGADRLADWLSAHIYLGLALILLATLHAGFQVGWNVHTLAYALMLLVIFSGVYGIYAYMRYPQLMTDNRRGMTLQQILAQIADLDREIRKLGLPLSEAINAALLESSQETVIGGNFWQQLRGHDPHCATVAARQLVMRQADTATGHEAATRQLLSLLTRKEGLLARARRDVQLLGYLKVWLFVHVPLTFGLLAAMAAHVLSVFYYW